MSGTPTGTPAEHAQTRLDVLKASPEWGAKLMSGDAATVAEFHELSAKALNMSVLPPPPAANPAQARLDKMMGDAGFVEKFQSGDAAAREAFNKASQEAVDGESTGDLADYLAGSAKALGMEFTVGPSSVTARTMTEAVASWRELGISDGAIYEIMNGRQIDTGQPWPPETIARVRAFRTQKINDPEWVARLQSRGWLEQRELMLFSGILMHYGP